MAKKPAKATINVRGTEISIIRREDENRRLALFGQTARTAGRLEGRAE